MTETYIQRLSNLAIYAVLLFANGPGFTGSFKTTPPTPPDHPSLLVPAKSAFLLWIPIHLFLTMFIIYQLLPKTYNLGYINTSITPLFRLHCLGNILWITIDKLSTTSYSEYRWMRIFFMPLILIPLLLSYLRTNNRVAIDLNNRSNSHNHFYQNYWFGRVWLSLYVGWIIYAFPVDFFSCLEVPATRVGYTLASITLTIIGTTVFFLVRIYSDAALSLVYVWVLYWLQVKNSSSSDSPSYPLYRTSLVFFYVFLLMTTAVLIRNFVFCLHRRQSSNSLPHQEDEERVLIVNSQSSPPQQSA